MNQNNFESNCTRLDDLGKQLGELKSTSEKVQIIIVMADLAVFALLWFLTPIPNWVIVVGCPLTTGAAYWIALRSPWFRSALRFFENGIELAHCGNRNVFFYDSLTSVSSKTQDHHHKGIYIGTKVEMEFRTDNPPRWLNYQCDFQRGSKKQAVIHQVLDHCSQGVQKGLCAKLENEGELVWTPNVSMTMNGLQLVDSAFDTTRLLLFEEIDDWNLEGDLLKIWKTGDGLPSIAIPSNVPNFAPMFALFCRMKDYFQQHDVVEAAVVEAEHTTPELVNG